MNRQKVAKQAFDLCFWKEVEEVVNNKGKTLKKNAPERYSKILKHQRCFPTTHPKVPGAWWPFVWWCLLQKQNKTRRDKDQVDSLRWFQPLASLHPNSSQQHLSPQQARPWFHCPYVYSMADAHFLEVAVYSSISIHLISIFSSLYSKVILR